MLLFRNKFVLFALAAIVAAGSAGCSGSRSLLPAAGGLTGPAAHLTPRFQRGKSQPPDFMQLAFLMTDGSILAQGESNWSNWYKYVPDASGSYTDGTWTTVASLPSGYAPDAYAAAVLPDGRLLISGGEYNSPATTTCNSSTSVQSTTRSRTRGRNSDIPAVGN